MFPKYKRNTFGQSNNNEDYEFVDDISYKSTSWNGYKNEQIEKFPNFPSNNRENAQNAASFNQNRKRKNVDYYSSNRKGESRKVYSLINLFLKINFGYQINIITSYINYFSLINKKIQLVSLAQVFTIQQPHVILKI